MTSLDTRTDRSSGNPRRDPGAPWIDGRSPSLSAVLRRFRQEEPPKPHEVKPNAATPHLQAALGRAPSRPEDLLAEESSVGERVPFLPLDRLIGAAEVAAVERAVHHVLPTGRFTGGPYVDTFEHALAHLVGLAHVATSSSGTDALMAALTAVGVRPGDEVVMPANSFAATENAVLAVGAEPVLCDIEQDTFTLDPDAIEGTLTPRTVAVLPVHLYGRRANTERISAVARAHGLAVVEDACQAIGLVDLGRFSDAVALSFNPYKNLGGIGKSGAVACRDPLIAEKANRYLYHGFASGKKNRKSDSYGLNSRMDNLQAAALLARMEHLALNNLRRLILADRYQRSIADHSLPVCTPEVGPDHTWHLYTVEVDAEIRDQVRNRMAERGVETDLFYPVLTHRQPSAGATSRFTDVALPVTERAHDRMFQLPLFPALTGAEQDRVVEVLDDALRRH